MFQYRVLFALAVSLGLVGCVKHVVPAAMAPAVQTVTPQAPAAVPGRKPLGDYVPCLFARSDDGFLRGQSLSPSAVSSTLDVGCSQSLLSWDEARDIFGARIANTYLAIQVVVRNLNPNEEFLMQDVQIALDARALPLGVTYGDSGLNNTRFVAGRDKMLARGVAMAGQQWDHRNFLIRIAEVLGDAALAAATLTGRAHFIDGVGIFKSVLIPGFSSIYPDLSIDQLNRLNDLGFSSSSAYKIVVPKNGSVPFVTFLPAKIFAAAPTRSTSSWHYKKWSQSDLLLLQESLYVVFAGVHVVEDTGN